MIKLLKNLFKILLIFSIIIIVGIFGIVNFVNPTQFKTIVEKQVHEQTGHTLTVEGPISWKWWPMLSLELEEIVFKAPTPSKETLFSAKSVTAEAALLPLLTGKLFLNLKVQGLDLRFERFAQGKTNWDPLKQRLMASNDTKVSGSEPNVHRFYLNSLEIENGQVSLKDYDKKIHYMLTNLNLSAANLFKGLLQNTNPISLSFNLQEDKTKTLAKLHLSTKWSLQQNFTQLNIQDFLLKLEPISGKPALLKANAEINNLKGSPLIQGNCETENIDLNTWLKNFNLAENAAIPPLVSVKFSFKYQFPQLEIQTFNIYSKSNGTLEGNVNLNLASAQSLDFKGNFLGKQLKFGTFILKEIKSDIIGKNNIINLSPMTFTIAGVVQKATLQIDLRNSLPRFALTSEGYNFEINQLLTSFDVKNKLAGKTNYTLKLNAAGKNAIELRKSLTGRAEFEVLNGKFYGINLMGVLKNAQASIHDLLNALVNKQSFNVKNTLNTEYQKWKVNPVSSQEFTPFDRAKASVNIENGLANNPDFSITHAEYNVSGRGTINLNNEAIQYHVSILPKNNPYPATDEIAQYLYSTPLPAVITGTLSNPVIRPDLDNYTNQALAYAQKHFVEKLINKTINKTLDKALENILVPRH